jgi:hypothetical protein
MSKSKNRKELKDEMVGARETMAVDLTDLLGFRRVFYNLEDGRSVVDDVICRSAVVVTHHIKELGKDRTETFQEVIIDVPPSVLSR